MPIVPRLGAGLRDYLPEDMIPRQKMIAVIRKVFESFGFLPLDTPGLELERILTGGDPNFDKLIFRAGLHGPETDGLALRFDLTVPLARVVAQYGHRISRPFKRYQIGPVWRGEKPQAGRFREFVQFDADIVGSSRMAADAEIISLIFETLRNLGLERFVVRVNNRKVLNGLAEFVNFESAKIPGVLRLIDKLDELGWDNVAGELATQFALSSDQLELIRRFLNLRSGASVDIISGVRDLMSRSPLAQEGIRELEQVAEQVKALGVPDNNWVIDLSVARGIGYYTGPVFEAVLTDLPSIGSVFSGGRYDGLVARFGSMAVPATGASVGVDRLFAAMEKLGLVNREKTTTQALVLNFDSNVEITCQSVTGELRCAGITTEIYLGKENGLKGQLAYAVRNEIPIVLIIGSRERQNDTVEVKDLRNGEQKTYARSAVVQTVQTILAL